MQNLYSFAKWILDTYFVPFSLRTSKADVLVGKDGEFVVVNCEPT